MGTLQARLGIQFPSVVPGIGDLTRPDDFRSSFPRPLPPLELSRPADFRLSGRRRGESSQCQAAGGIRPRPMLVYTNRRWRKPRGFSVVSPRPSALIFLSSHSVQSWISPRSRVSACCPSSSVGLISSHHHRIDSAIAYAPLLVECRPLCQHLVSGVIRREGRLLTRS